LTSDLNLGAAPDSKRSEIRDAKLIFDLVSRAAPAACTHVPCYPSTSSCQRQVWTEMLARHPIETLVFPREIVWLSGAPGAGKGESASVS